MPVPAWAFCGAFVGAPGSALVNHSSEVVLARDGDRTTLTLVMDYSGDANNFALLLPVPQVLGPDDVRSIDQALLDWLADYSTPRLVEYSCEDMFEEPAYYGSCSMFGCSADYALDGSAGDYAAYDSATGVSVASSFREYGYEFVVLDAEESAGLTTWLATNGFALPEGGESILQEYIDGGSYFLAAKIDLDNVEMRDGWLPPIRFTYNSPVFSLPIRIGTISADGVQDVVMYTLTSDVYGGQVGIANYPRITLDTECMPPPEAGDDFSGWFSKEVDAQVAATGAAWLKEYSWDLIPTAGTGYHCDPCTATPAAPTPDGSFAAFGLPSNSAHITRLRMRYLPEKAVADLTLYESGIAGQTDQLRYVTYKPELEFLYPICDQGFASDPGTCPKPPPEEGSWPWTTSALFMAGAGVAVAKRRRV